MSKVNRLLKKAHLLRCAQSPRSNVSVNTPPLVDFSCASHLDLFEQPGIIVFQQALKSRSSDWCLSSPLPTRRFLCILGGSATEYPACSAESYRCLSAPRYRESCGRRRRI